MTRERLLYIVSITDTALKLEPDWDGQLVDLVCQYGKGSNVTPEEFDKVWDMTIGEIFSYPTQKMEDDDFQFRNCGDPEEPVLKCQVPGGCDDSQKKTQD